MDPTLIGVLVGGGLTLVGTVVTQLWTSSRDAKRHDREETERRRREVSIVRSDWAASFMDAHIASVAGVRWWRLLAVRPRGDAIPDAAFKESASARAAQDRARAATARLLVVDRDPMVRAVAPALMVAFEVDLPDRAAPEDVARLADVEERALGRLHLAFMNFMDLLADAGDRAAHAVSLRQYIAESPVPELLKQAALAQMDAAERAKRAIAPPKDPAS